MYRSNIHFRPSISERWSQISPLIKNVRKRIIVLEGIFAKIGPDLELRGGI